jgi:predicted Zn-dependent peptidase
VIVNLKSSTLLSGFYIVFKGSTNFEKKGIFGISYLIEHLICQKLKKLQSLFFSKGISWNAYTSLNEVVFFFRGLDDNLERVKNKIINYILDIDLTEKSLEKEKKIILEEFSQYFSRPSNNHFYNFTLKNLGSYGPMGLEDDIRNISLLTTLNYYGEHFLEPSLVINVSQKYPYRDDSISFSKKTISKDWRLLNNNTPSRKQILGDDQSYIILFSKLQDNDFNWIGFINLLLCADHSSILLNELRFKSGLVYDVQASQTRFNNKSITTISTSVNKKNTQQTIDIIMDSLENLPQKINRSQVEGLKKNLFYLEKIKKIDRYKNVSKWINPDGWEVESILKDIHISVLEEKIKKYYNPKNFEVSIQSSE